MFTVEKLIKELKKHKPNTRVMFCDQDVASGEAVAFRNVSAAKITQVEDGRARISEEDEKPNAVVLYT